MFTFILSYKIKNWNGIFTIKANYNDNVLYALYSYRVLLLCPQIFDIKLKGVNY